MELFIALALFIGLVIAWIMLPGSMTTPTSVERESSAEGIGVHQPA